MPEIVGYNPQLEKVASALRSPREFSNDVDFRAYSLQDRGEVKAAGGESVILPKDESERKLVGLDYAVELSVGEAKALYYGHKAFRILFPHNFPRIHAAYGAKNEGDRPQFKNGAAKNNTGTVRETIFLDSEKIANRKFSFENVKQFCRDVSVDPDILFDDERENLGDGEDGGEYYLDKIWVAELQDADISLEDVELWMRTHTVVDKQTEEERKYSQLEIREVVRSLGKAKSYDMPYIASNHIGEPMEQVGV